MWTVLALIFSNLFSILLFFIYGYLKGFVKGSEAEKKILNKSIWHDLTKNPEDLPKKDGLYPVFTREGYKEIEFYKFHYRDCDRRPENRGKIGKFDTDLPVYAWCEPFEKDGRFLSPEEVLQRRLDIFKKNPERLKEYVEFLNGSEIMINQDAAFIEALGLDKEALLNKEIKFVGEKQC